MPSTLPVPSKGALRALRKLALGTSCTIAFSVGILAEDRRRRIHSAKRVHENAVKLKSSKNYHRSKSPFAETLERQVPKSRDDGTLLFGSNGTAMGNAQSIPTDREVSTESPKAPREPESRSQILEGRTERHAQRSGQTRTQCIPVTPRVTSDSKKPLRTRKTRPAKKVVTFEPMVPKQRYKYDPLANIRPRIIPQTSKPIQRLEAQGKETVQPEVDRDCQVRLASDIRQILRGGNGQIAVDAALSRLYEVFDEGVDVESDGLKPCLVDAVSVLSASCASLRREEDMESILDIFLGAGNPQLEAFDSLRPDAVVLSLMESSTMLQKDRKFRDRLRKAASIYLTQFGKPAPPNAVASTLLPIGSKICFITCCMRQYDLTIKVYKRTEAAGGTLSDEAKGSFIVASFKDGNYEDAISYFFSHFLNTLPNDQMFWDVINAVTESVIRLDRHDMYDKSESIIVAALKMAETIKLKLTTTTVLKLLGGEWRATRNISRVRARFDRLEHLLPLFPHPQAAYSAIIQFCIEANDFEAAEVYHNRLSDAYGYRQDLRIAGHFALAKALQGDWDGVKTDFARMAELEVNIEVYGSIFTPILKLFVNSHPITETEKFLQCFLELQVPITQKTFNLMINAYAKAKEIDSMARWIGYASSISTVLDSTFFNTILNNLHETWNFTFEETSQIYLSVRKQAPSLTDDYTVSLLRGLAIADSKGNLSAANKKLIHIAGLWESVEDARANRSKNSRSIHLKMVEALSSGDPESALKIYRQAVDGNAFLSPSVIGKAVKASLQLYGEDDLSNTVSILREAKEKGWNLDFGLVSLVLHNLTNLELHHTDKHELMEAARAAINAVEQNGIVVPQVVLTRAVYILVRKGHFAEAIDFWRILVRSRSTKIQLDAAILTVILKAYIGLRDPTGITWVMTMLSVNNVIPDNRFRVALRNTRYETRLDNPKTRFHKVLDEAFECVLDLRASDFKEKMDVKAKVNSIMAEAIESELESEPELEIG